MPLSDNVCAVGLMLFDLVRAGMWEWGWTVSLRSSNSNGSYISFSFRGSSCKVFYLSSVVAVKAEFISISGDDGQSLGRLPREGKITVPPR
ncbi:hypothetical protein GGR53DRAFT_499618 [Hypoxylon sp. FL1150]|nr:hypothetical protein GGR53DRAFT_499618 [Hypoxylon sp. FL1150]